MNPQDEAKLGQRSSKIGLTPLPPKSDEVEEPDEFRANQFTPAYWLQRIDRNIGSIRAMMILMLLLTLLSTGFSILSSMLGLMGNIARAVPHATP